MGYFRKVRTVNFFLNKNNIQIYLVFDRLLLKREKKGNKNFRESNFDEIARDQHLLQN